MIRCTGAVVTELTPCSSRLTPRRTTCCWTEPPSARSRAPARVRAGGPPSGPASRTETTCGCSYGPTDNANRRAAISSLYFVPDEVPASDALTTEAQAGWDPAVRGRDLGPAPSRSTPRTDHSELARAGVEIYRAAPPRRCTPSSVLVDDIVSGDRPPTWTSVPSPWTSRSPR
ncbi:hypothetical protein QJS66_16935 [Kocuria rhizophila]|nr:hypothetical protein QJS66_16935 [Kocuria rhizophila]